MTYAVVSLTGNVGSDPETRRTQTGELITFSLAVNYKRAGDEYTDWYRCVAFSDALVRVVGEYVKKGSRISVVGDLQMQKWKDRDEIERTTPEVNIFRLDLGAPTHGGRDEPRRDDRRGGYGGRDEPRRDDRRGYSNGRDDRRGGYSNGRDDRRAGGGRDDRGGYGGRERPGSGTTQAGGGRGGPAWDTPRGGGDLDDEIPF